MDYVAQAIDKHTGYFGTSYATDTKESATKTAKYFRSIGYKAKVFAWNEYLIALEENYIMRCEQMKMQRSA